MKVAFGGQLHAERRYAPGRLAGDAVPQAHRQQSVEPVVELVRHVQRPRLHDQADAALAHRLDQQVEEAGIEHPRRNVAQDDGVILGQLVERARQGRFLFLVRQPPPFGLQHDVRLFVCAAGQAVVAAHGVFEKAEVPARQTFEVEDLDLLVADADEGGVGVVAAEVLGLLRLRRHGHRQVTGAGLVGLEIQIDVLLFAVAQRHVLGVKHLVAFLQLDLDDALVEALRFDGRRHADIVADRHFTGGVEADHGHVLKLAHRPHRHGEEGRVGVAAGPAGFGQRAAAGILAVGKEQHADQLPAGGLGAAACQGRRRSAWRRRRGAADRGTPAWRG